MFSTHTAREAYGTDRLTRRRQIAGSLKCVGQLSDGEITPDQIKDSCGDGIHDWWKKANGLNPVERSDGNATILSKTGYTSLEVYMNSLVEEITLRQNGMNNPFLRLHLKTNKNE